ncbi:polyphosphate polymerase domain-containing protein [Candidatus Saccharibacteria bacterium]|nr:polyphosphate polymerase domain-containing protein [Candidatus Saccharibacteria bacterium]
MDEKIFDRTEKKYLIDTRTKKKVLTAIKNEIEKDKYFESEIFNIYFDTDNFDLIIKSIDNPNFKEKLRARAYGGYDKVFLEIKTKMRGKGDAVGHKRRVLITHQDYKKLVRGEKTVAELSNSQIAKEVDYLISYFKLKPQILLYYNRESYVGKNNLRITFDKKLSYRDDSLDFKRKVSDKRYFNDKKNIIMEIKVQNAMPLWLVKVLSENKIYPERFSKIGKIYEKIRKEQNV